MSASPRRRPQQLVGYAARGLAVACALLVASSAIAQRATPPVRPRHTAATAPARDASPDSVSDASAGPDASSSPPPSSSSSPPPPGADLLAAQRVRAGEEFAAGTEAYRRGDFVAAANHFEVAYQTLPDPAPLFNMARSWESSNELGRAIDAYQRYADTSPDAADRAEVLQRISLLRGRPTAVFVSSDPAGAFVYLDEETEPQRDTTPSVLRVVPGPHVIVIDREGHRRAVRRFTARPGVTETLSVALEPAVPGTAGVPGTSRLDPRVLNRRRGSLLSGRFTYVMGAARPYNNQPYALTIGANATLFIGRGITSTLHFERIEPDGVWTLVTGDFGYTLGIDDIDIALVATAGVGYGWIDHAAFMARAPMVFVPVLGFEAHAEWVFHPHLSIGLYFRAAWRNFGVAPVEPLNSLGGSISLLF